ncbi:2-iminobutanoate/2-iminopropanoate deaminase [Collimonas sp. OK242]|jgi:2-iminobutanoate/2-iminopropanoate deaminase|nr:2-iminobutanoate/2-iminopropanoate deaminase [Collimonas sp. OK242]
MRAGPHLSPVAKSQNLLFISGQLARNAQGQIAGDIEQQTQQVMSNLENILKSNGLKLEHVIKTTVWLRRATDFDLFNQTYAQILNHVRPARSTLVSELLFPEALIEVEAIAACP